MTRIAVVVALGLALASGIARADATVPGRPSGTLLARCRAELLAATGELRAQGHRLPPVAHADDATLVLEWDPDHGEHDLASVVVDPSARPGDWTRTRRDQRVYESERRGRGLRARVASDDNDVAFVLAMERAIDTCLAPPGPVPSSFAGRYRLSGFLQQDGCDGRVRLASETITIAKDERSLDADVVSRHYAARRAGPGLDGEGRFESKCGAGGVEERWHLEHAGRLVVGTIASTWRLPAACDQPCTVVYELVGAPVP